MALIVKAVGQTFTKFLGFAGGYPVRRGLVGAYFLGSEETDLLRNHAGGDPLVVVGAPTVNVRSALVRRANGYDTGIPETAAFTWIAVVKKLNPGNIAPVISNFNDQAADADIGSTLAQTAGNIIGSYVNQGGASIAQKFLTSAEIPVGDPMVMGTRCSGVSHRPFKSHSGVLTHDAAGAVVNRSLDTAQLISIGHHDYTGYDYEQEVYAAIVHNVELTDQEVADAVAFLRARYAVLGVSTL